MGTARTYSDGNISQNNRVMAAWLNGTNTVVFTLFGNGSEYTGNANLPANLAVAGNVTIAQKLDVTGNTTLGNVTVNGAFSPTGNQSFGNTTITGQLSVVGNASVSGTLAAGNITTAGNLTVSGTFAPVNITASGNGTIGGTLGVTGNLSAAALVNISAAGAGQILFPATQNPSSGANNLDDYAEGTYTGTLTGCTTSPTTSINYTKIGNAVIIHAIGGAGATSNSVAKTITGMPAAIRPAADVYGVGIAVDNGGSAIAGRFLIATSGVITIYPNVTGDNWTASGTMSFTFPGISYTLAA